MKQKFNIITSTCIPLPLENVDTDQIIPARFLKATTRDEKFFGDNLFRDWRYNPDGSLNKDFMSIFYTKASIVASLTARQRISAAF
jgi:3-isopropylmalate/(R)-2-methylmalate dehydratase small subunit